MVAAGVGAESPNLSYRERVFEWIRKTFPHQNHTFFNGALAAASSTYIHQCINDFVPVDTDLAIVEFTMNDSQSRCGVDNDGRCVKFRRPILVRCPPQNSTSKNKAPTIYTPLVLDVTAQG